MIPIRLHTTSGFAWSLLALALACGSSHADGLFVSREGESGGAAGAGGAGAGGVSAQAGFGGGGSPSAGSAGTDSGAGGAAGDGPLPPEPDAGLLDAGNADAASADAGEAELLGCLAADQANCSALLAALVHRYSFEGTGSSVPDSVGNADGNLVNAQLSGTGSVSLSGTDDFVDLPNGIVSQLSSGSFEAWVNWSGGEIWQRIFDFGSSDDVEGTPGVGAEYLFLTARASDDNIRVVFRTSATNGEIQVSSAAPLPTGQEEHIAVVLDAQLARLSLYVNGALVGATAITDQLSSIGDVNNWLGLSQFAADALFEGSIAEFRIYSAALTADQVRLSFDLGPDAPLSP